MTKRPFACFAVKLIELYNLNIKYRKLDKEEKEKGEKVERDSRKRTFVIYL